MKGFANGIIHSLAFVAILLMQPIGQQYCTANDALCSSVFSSDCESQLDCCENHSEEKESPCCVELFSKLPFIPGNTDSVLPVPNAFEFLLPEPVFHLEGFDWKDLGNSKIADVDPPPRSECSLVRLCVRLV